MHNAGAPIIGIKPRLFSTAFCHRGARLIKVNCRCLAYLSACGKYLQLLMLELSGWNNHLHDSCNIKHWSLSCSLAHCLKLK